MAMRNTGFRDELIGTGHFYSARKMLIDSQLTIFDDGDRAGFLIRPLDPQKHGHVAPIIMPGPNWKLGTRMLIGALHEFCGYQFIDPQEEARAQRARQLRCNRCMGSGQIEDFEGNWVACPECQE